MVAVPITNDVRSKAALAFQNSRLSYVLPDFTRVSWVSDDARTVWEPRLSRIGAAWNAVESASIGAGIRRCALTSVAAESLVPRTAAWAREGFSAMPVAVAGAVGGYSSTAAAPKPGEAFEYRVAVGALRDVASLHDAMQRGDDSAMGQLLGFPECCIAFFRDTWVNKGCVDTTWSMAGGAGQFDEEGRLITIGGHVPFQSNILWRWMGVRAVPHLPCQFACQATTAFANALLQIGRDRGYGDEMDWIEEILSWPASWSALHGIAEIKTPVLKVSTRTDATAHKFVVHYAGSRVPREAATGLSFPFNTPARAGISQSAAFQRGLSAPIAPSTETPDWYATDNGFNTRAAMDEAHRPLVELAASTLGETGSVLDLGCGNGALLRKIVDRQRRVMPFGVDGDAGKIAHARQLQPSFAANFIVSDMFEALPLDADTRYSMVILMPGRLLEVDEGRAARLRQWLRGHFDQLLVYGYGEWLTRYGSLEGLAAQAKLTLLKTGSNDRAALARIQ